MSVASDAERGYTNYTIFENCTTVFSAPNILGRIEIKRGIYHFCAAVATTDCTIETRHWKSVYSFYLPKEKNMIQLQVKPLSVNECRQWRRYKTAKYHSYEQLMLSLLSPLDIAKNKPLFLSINVWFSSKASDLDNVAKPFIDILQKRYWFDDKMIFEISMRKEIVAKWKEYIAFLIERM